MNKLTKKCVAAIASLAMAGTLCVAGAVTMASVAWGVPHPVVRQDPVSQEPWGTHLPKEPYSITIVNCDAKEDTSATSGACDANHKPLDGAEFKLTPIKKIGDTDLTATGAFKKAETWAKIAETIDALNRGDEKDAKIVLDTDTSKIKTQTVGNTGEAKFEQVPLGFYKVEETKMPTGNYGANDMTVFYMTLPQIERKQDTNNTQKTVTDYNYNPIVKIKNKDLSSAITKVFSTEKGSNAVSTKDDFKYVISSEVNHPAGTLDEKSIQDYMVFDDAPTEAFDTITDAAVESVTVDGLTDALAKTTDYTVEVKKNDTQAKKTDDGDEKNLEAGNTRILVKFNESGLSKIAGALNKAKSGTEPKVHVTVSFKLSEAYKGNTGNKNEIKNKSGFFKSHPSNATKDPDPIVSGDDSKGTSTVKFGLLQVKKYDKNNTDTKLPGAVFKIFNSEAKAEACKTALLKRSAGSTDVPTECSDGASTNFAGTTNDQGKFATDQKVIAGRMVYLVEVTAPTDYALANEVRGVTVEEGKTTTVDFPNTKISDLKIDTWFNLPATGAAGVILFALAGMGLIVASVFLYMRNRKEEEQQAKA